MDDTGSATPRPTTVADRHGEGRTGGTPGIPATVVEVVRCTALGVAIGVGYGVALRLWMRLVSTDPAFTWGGTGYVVGVFAVLGTTAGLTTGLRRRGSRRGLLAVRATGVVLSLGCFLAAGAAMFPTVVPAGLAVARTDWPRRLRLVLAVVGTVAAVAVVVTMTGLSWPRRAVALATYLPLCGVEVAMVARLYAPSLPPGTLGRRTGIALTVAVLLLAAIGVLLLVGRPGGG